MIIESELVKLYVEDRWASRKIAQHFNIDKSSVLRKLKKLGIERTHAKREFEMRKKVQLTRVQKELVWGTMLGDGHVAKHGQLARLMVSHCKKQYELSKWLCEQLRPISLDLRTKIDSRTGFEYFEFNTITHIEFNVIREKFYKDSVKIVPDDLPLWLTPRSLGLWIMDDGSLNKGVNLRLQTDSFTEQENIKLLDIMKINFNVNGNVREYMRKDKKYYFLSFNKRNTQIISDIVRPFIIPIMEYKIMRRSSTTTCETSPVEEDIV